MQAVVILSKLEQEYLLRVVEASVQVRDERQFFLWAQGQLQLLLPHQLMLCMQFDAGGELQRLECLHGAVLGDALTARLRDPADGLARRLAQHCAGGQRLPAYSGDGELGEIEASLRAAGFAHLLVHGSGPLGGSATLFALCGLPARPGVRQAYFLELLLPHLHLALPRLSARAETVTTEQQRLPRPLSAREVEILQWVREGKSNYEVACILGISALTVKNHLQRVYQTLGVSNRAHALSRCMSLRLLTAPARPPAPH